MKIICLLLLIISNSSFGEIKEYKLVEKTGVTFHLPYTLGTHDGEVRIGKDHLNMDLTNPINSSGEFIVSIDSMTTGDSKRDCHMREALGLNYEQSDFPKEHVCNENNQLPLTGKNAVVFPEIIYKILSLKSLDKSGTIHADMETLVEVEGQWTIHGVNQKEKMLLKMTPENGKFRIQGETQFSLKSYNVVVKSAKVLFITIEVKDHAKVNFNLLIEPELKKALTRIKAQKF